MKISKYVLFLTIFSLPLYVLRASDFPTTFLEILIFATLGLWFLERVFEGDFNFRLFKTPFDLLILLLLVVSVIETALSPDLKGGLGILKAYFLDPVFLFYLSVWWGRKEGVRFLLWALLSCSVTVSVVSIIQVTTGYFVFAPREFLLGRATSFFNSANSVGLLIGPILALSFPFILQFKKDLFGLFVVFAALLSFVAIFLTESRGTYISLILVLAFYLGFFMFRKLAVSRKSKIVLPVVMTLSPLILVGLVYLSMLKNNLTPPVGDFVYRGANTMQIRLYLWKGTFQLISDHPLFGAGLNGFKDTYSGNYALPQYTEALQYPHNLWLTIYSELGFFGFLIFLAVFFVAFRLIFTYFEEIRKNIRNEKLLFGYTALPLGLLGALLYIQIHGLVDVPYFKNDLACQFWIMIGLVTSLRTMERKKLSL